MKRTLSLLIASAFALATAYANTIGVSNLDKVATGGKFLDTQAANSFTTGSGPGWILDSLTLLLSKNSGDPDYINVGIWSSDINGLPGSALSLPGLIPVLNDGIATHTLAGNGLITLAPNTKYWVVAEDSTASTTIWEYAFGQFGETGLPGWTIGDDHYQNSGSGWTATSPDFTPFMFSVDVTAVPEPGSTLALLGLGMAGLTVLRRRILA